MQWINPCRKCLVKVCCNKWCEKRYHYETFCSSVLPLILFIIASLLAISLVVILITLFSDNFISILVLLMVWVISIIVDKYLFDSTFYTFTQIKKGEITDLKEVTIICLLAPIVLITFSLDILYEKYLK